MTTGYGKMLGLRRKLSLGVFVLVAMWDNVAGKHVPDHHPVHLLSRERLKKIERHNPLLLPHHPNHHDNFVLESMPKTLSVSPADFGGDPTGKRDSTWAVQAAVTRCYNMALNNSARSPNATVWHSPSSGNCEVNLGGQYLISAPIVTHKFSDFIFGYGSLVAAANWTAESDKNFLIYNDDWSQRGHSYPELYLDGAHLAGGIKLNNTCAMTIGPGTVVQRFVGVGIYVYKGCEVMIDRSWLAELPDDNMNPTATGVLIEGSDHDVTNIVVWSMLVGLHIKDGGDTMVTGVHNWYPGNIELEIPGQMLYLVESGEARFDSCMIDNGKAVFQGRGLSDNMWLNGLEFSNEDVNKTHGIILNGDTISRLTIQRIKFDHAARVYHNGSASPIVEDTIINHNSGPGVKATRAGLSLSNASSPQFKWWFDFRKVLLFPINHVRVVTSSGGNDFISYKNTISNYTLLVETSSPVISVFAEVDSSAFTSNFA